MKKHLSETFLFLFALFGQVSFGAMPVTQKSSIRLGMTDTLMVLPNFSDTIISDTTKTVYAFSTISYEDWKYEPMEVMPDPSIQGWWKGFNDQLLDTLIKVAVRNNFDVRIAAKRMELSQLALKKAYSSYYPTVSAQAGWTADRTSEYMGSRRTPSSSGNYFNLGLQTSWEIDVFGRVKQHTKLNRANLNVSRADYAAAISSLCAQLTESYIQLRVYQGQLEVARRLSVSQNEVLRVATVRHDCTLASGLDVSQAKTVCLSTQATIPSLETSIATTINAIMVMLGTTDNSQLASQLAIEKPIPIYTMPLDVDISPELLRRRPDVQAAEQQIAAYAAQIGVAKKDFLPTLSLDAQVGTTAHNLGNLFKHDALAYTVQPTLSWTIFNRFSRKYAVAEAKEQMLIGLDEYNMTLQQAAADVDNAIVSYRNSLRRIGLLNAVLAESIKSFDFSLDQYKQGLSPFLNLINAQIDVLNYNNNLVQERGNAQIAVMELYKALGGGW